MGKLDQLKQLVFESDNNACFIERDRILQRLESELPDPDAPDYYAQILSALLAEVSTPVLACDYFAGRVVEALPEEGIPSPHTLLCTIGHQSPDYSRLLSLGLKDGEGVTIIAHGEDEAQAVCAMADLLQNN